MEWVKSNDFPQEMAANAQNLDSALSEMETVVNLMTSMPLTEAHSCVSYNHLFQVSPVIWFFLYQMKPLERSKYDTASVYAVTSLFWGEVLFVVLISFTISIVLVLAYMKTQGADPKTNGLPKELERVKNVIGRAKQIADKAFAPKVDVGAAKRFIHGGLWEPKDGEKKDAPSVKSQGRGEDVPKPPPNKRIRFDDDTNSTQLNNEER